MEGEEKLYGPAAGAAVGAAAGWAVDYCYEKVRDRLVGHVDEYRALDAMLMRGYTEIRLDSLQDKVSEVLGRKLIL